MRFADPLFLLALVPLALVFWWDLRRRWGRARLGYPDARFFPRRGWRARAVAATPALLAAAGTLLIVSLARPRPAPRGKR